MSAFEDETLNKQHGLNLQKVALVKGKKNVFFQKPVGPSGGGDTF